MFIRCSNEAVIEADENDNRDDSDDEPYSVTFILRNCILKCTRRLLCPITIEIGAKIALGESRTPVSYDYDEHAEEANFIKIFGGQLMMDKTSKDLTLQSRYKSFLRRFDRRCAGNAKFLFVAFRKLMYHKLVNSINYTLRKLHTNNLEQITVQDVLSNPISDFVMPDNYQTIFRTIRSSPEYFQQKRKIGNAMIRQLGSPSLSSPWVRPNLNGRSSSYISPTSTTSSAA